MLIDLERVNAAYRKAEREAYKFAKKHDLVLAQRTRDGIPETLDPSFIETYTETCINWKGETTLVKRQRFLVDLPDQYVEKGNDLECWIPSQFC